MSEEKVHFCAHYNPVTDEYQLLSTHGENTQRYADKKNTIGLLKNIVYLAAILHDQGKNSEQWQMYLKKRIEDKGGYFSVKEDHTTAGGLIIDLLVPGTLLSEMVQIAIYSHHGLQDSISVEDGNSLYIKRRKKEKSLPIEECKNHFFQQYDEKAIFEKCKMAQEDARKIMAEIKEHVKQWGSGKLYGNPDFFLGMYERILMSLLIDADRRDTEDFMAGTETDAPLTEEKLVEVWTKCCANVEQRIKELSVKVESVKKDKEVLICRQKISEQCKNEAKGRAKLYQLAVPTGAGKTLSSLRFAVTHAQEYKKKRIIYVAPYQSVVDQNAKAIRDAIGIPEIVLEHHCSIIKEMKEDQEKYDRVTEDWSNCIVVTTFVQLLNTLFADKPSNVRRMHSLCDSVIIIDEVQTLPIKLMELFSMSINFLTEFAGATVVLCTATQPLLDELPQNRLLSPYPMIPDIGVYQDKLRRTEIMDCTKLVPQGMDIDQAARFALKKLTEHRKVLFIVNTKECAAKLYQRLAQLCGEDTILHHLSTNMYSKHRMDIIKEVSAVLKDESKMQICVSTSLLEAGVDISSTCVIRTMTGLDSLIQAAGRCNREHEYERGYVYLIKMSMEVENVSRMSMIVKAQQAMQSVLESFREDPEAFDGRLDSDKSVRYYFKSFLEKVGNETCYPSGDGSGLPSLVELLSSNAEIARRSKDKQMFKQAFKTAGERFEVIEEMGNVGVIVSREDDAKHLIRELEDEDVSMLVKKKILRKLQQYAVAISKKKEEEIGMGIRPSRGDWIKILDERFYDENLGVTTNPKPMEFLEY